MTVRHLDPPWSGPLTRYALTQAFGPTNVTSEPSYQSYAHYHFGADYGLLQGTPVLAGAAGTVTFAGWDSTGYGNCVVVDHGDLGSGDVGTLYGHLDQITVRVGQSVATGQQLGLSGETGNATGPHLHLGVLQSGAFVDPVPYLQASTYYRLTAAMHLRAYPTKYARQGALLPVGAQVVTVDAAPDGYQMIQDGWAWCRTSGDVQGYLLIANMSQYVPS